MENKVRQQVRAMVQHIIDTVTPMATSHRDVCFGYVFRRDVGHIATLPYAVQDKLLAATFGEIANSNAEDWT